jgi:hypothetical protein
MQVGVSYLHAIGKQERALKLAGRDPTVQKNPILIWFILASTDKEFFVLNHDLKFFAGESSHSKRDAKPFRL